MPNEKAEPPPTRDVNRDSGTASANGGWLRRLVRRRPHSENDEHSLCFFAPPNFRKNPNGLPHMMQTRLDSRSDRTALFLASLARSLASASCCRFFVACSTAARRETTERLAAMIAAGRDDNSPFPWAEVALEGEIDRLVAERPALEAEDCFSRPAARQSLARRRRRTRRCRPADQRSRRAPRPAMRGPPASTGEQKALLVGLVLAHARLVAAMSGLTPLVLLDEIAADFDPLRRRALFDALAALGGQIWMTGADVSLFEDLRGRADIFKVSSSRIAPVSHDEATND